MEPTIPKTNQIPKPAPTRTLCTVIELVSSPWLVSVVPTP